MQIRKNILFVDGMMLYKEKFQSKEKLPEIISEFSKFWDTR